MVSKGYKKAMKEVEDLQRKLNSDKRRRVFGNGDATFFRYVGWIMKQTIKLVIAMIILVIIVSVIQYSTTGRSTLLELLGGL